MNSKFTSTTNKKVKEYFQHLVRFKSIKSTYVIHEYSSTCNAFLTMSLEICAKLWAPDVAISFSLPQLASFLLLNVCNQGFETRTRPYGPTGKTSNRSCLRFVKPQEPLHGKIAGTRENHGRTSRFWEPWSNRFSRFPASVNLKLKKKKKQTNTEKQKKKKHNSAGSTSCLQKHCHCHL